MEDGSFYIVTAVTGLLFAVFHRKLGKSAVEFRKQMLGAFLPKSAFGSTTVIITQIGFLLIGALVFIVSIGKLLI